MATGSHRATGSSIIVSSLEEFNEAIHHRYPVSNWYFRGESREYEEPFLATIWRTDHKYLDRTPIQPDTSFSVGELEALNQCQADALSGLLDDNEFLANFADPSKPIDLTSIDMFNWLAFAQHYNEDQRYPTRLLDVSKDPLIGLYFAVSKYLDSPGFVFVFNYNFNDLDIVGEVTRRGGTFLDVLRIDGMDGLPYDPKENTLNLLEPPFRNERLIAQKGTFIWTRGIQERYHTGGFPFEIPPNHKAGILKELEDTGYTADTLFPY